MGHRPCELGVQRYPAVLGAYCWGRDAEGGDSGTEQGFLRLFAWLQQWFALVSSKVVMARRMPVASLA